MARGRRARPPARPLCRGRRLTTVVAGLATAPFAIYHFNRFALYSVAANLIAVPLTGLWIMPWAIAAFILMPLGLEALALAPMGWGIEAVIGVAATVAAWPGAVALAPAMPVAGLAGVAFGGLWLCLWRRRWRVFGFAAMAAGLMTLGFARPPDVLVNGTGRLMAVRTAAGELALSSTRRSRFQAETWLRRSGRKDPAPWPREGSSPSGDIRCDGLGCIYHAGGLMVALIKHRAALRADCATADVVIATFPVRWRGCRRAKVVIDRFDLWREGAHALWLRGGAVRIRTVAEASGHRPWNPYEKRRAQSAKGRR